MKYDHKKIEKKWQKYWLENKTFKTEVDHSKPKYYILDMFPYPSGSRLHVGHVEGYTATDILARYKRLKGFNVLHPMGWDSFGLPAEQHAIRTGTHPGITTEQNINNFREQLQSLGFSYDWDREFATSDPAYYKWTQWIFTKLYERGLAYEAELPVNYCPTLGTVLANEEVEDGRSKEGGYPVERRPLRQWVLKITEYADKLLHDLDMLDWPDHLKKLQRNWIGKSIGAHITFSIKGHSGLIKVFTTRPDTLFGATFMVLSPEHPLVEEITTEKERETIQKYKKVAASKSDLDRTDLNKEKTGAFTGAYALNPATGKQIPIWISDYVLMSYGTGAIMAVPAHDERDFEFAKKYELPVIPVYAIDFKAKLELLPEGVEPDQAQNELLSGNRCLSVEEGTYINSANKEVSLNGINNFIEACEVITNWLEEKGLGKKAVSFKLRDWLFSRQRYWGEPFPILHFADGTKRVLDIDELPLIPPQISDYKPSGDGKSPLARNENWVEIIDAKTGKPAKRETNTMPQWAGSCWYYLRFCDAHNPKEAWSPEAEKYWMAVDLYVGGVEHAVLHLLYARFWHKVLFDCGLVSTPEPFMKLYNQGIVTSRSYQDKNRNYVYPEDVVEKDGAYFHRSTGEELTSQVEKMSKSKLNGVAPDDILEEFGADSLRLYEMFMGPLDREKIWNTDAVSGCRRFLSRFFEMATSEKVKEQESEEASRLGYRLVYNVGKDIEALQFNTAIAKMMEFMNSFTKLEFYPKSVVKMVTQVLQPFAPHIAEEIWEHLGCEEELSYSKFPEVDEKYLHDENATYIIQVNGKVRGRFDLPKGQTQDQMVELAKQDANVSRFLENVTIKQVIFVPDKLLNIVVK